MPTSTAAVKATTLRPPGGAVPFLVNASTIVAGRWGHTPVPGPTGTVYYTCPGPTKPPPGAAGSPSEPRQPTVRGVGAGRPPVVRRGLAPPAPGCDDAPVDV